MENLISAATWEDLNASYSDGTIELGSGRETVQLATAVLNVAAYRLSVFQNAEERGRFHSAASTFAAVAQTRSDDEVSRETLAELVDLATVLAAF